MKRIMVLMAVVALMVVMLGMTVAPAFASNGYASCVAYPFSGGRAPQCPGVGHP